MTLIRRTTSIAALTVGLLAGFVPADPPRDTAPGTWAAIDALGRRMNPLEYPPVRSGRFVGVFYFLWMQGGERDRVYDITRILAADPGNPAWGAKHAFHFWGRPYFGYYRSDDEWVIARHAQMLSDAGVDVIVFDVTNAVTYDATVLKVCEVFARLREAGRETPQIAFLTHSKSVQTVGRIYDLLYAKNRYPQLWFRWKGKPLLMTSADGLDAKIADFFTVRESWAWTGADGWFKNGRAKWPWLDHTPQKFGWIDSPDKPEQIAVAVSQHPTTPIGRSFHDGKQPAAGKCEPARGLYFAEQWKRAMEVDPEFVFITGWNEWIAQRFLKETGTGPAWVGHQPLKSGDSFFVDCYSQEFSRDIEPMAGGHGDNYYYQMVDGIRRFKGVPPTPKAGGATTIAVTRDFSQWNAVTPEYRDDIGDTDHRNAIGYGDAGRLANASGRNDIEACKVTYDADNVYFYVRTKDDLTPPAKENWMTLLIDAAPEAGGDRRGGWAGFTLAVNRTAPRDGRTSVEHYTTGKWAAAGQARIVFAGRDMHVAVPRSLITSVRVAAPRFDFKWTDNGPVGGDAAGFIDQGDAAPNGRFRYRFGVKAR